MIAIVAIPLPFHEATQRKDPACAGTWGPIAIVRSRVD